MCFCLVSSLQCFPQKAHSLSLSGVLPLKTTVKITSWVSSVNESHRYCFSAQQKAPVITPGATKYLKLDPSPLPSSQTSLLFLADITFFCLQVPKAESLFVSLNSSISLISIEAEVAVASSFLLHICLSQFHSHHFSRFNFVLLWFQKPQNFSLPNAFVPFPHLFLAKYIRILGQLGIAFLETKEYISQSYLLKHSWDDLNSHIIVHKKSIYLASWVTNWTSVNLGYAARIKQIALCVFWWYTQPATTMPRLSISLDSISSCCHDALVTLIYNESYWSITHCIKIWQYFSFSAFNENMKKYTHRQQGKNEMQNLLFEVTCAWYIYLNCPYWNQDRGSTASDKNPETQCKCWYNLAAFSFFFHHLTSE